MSKIISPEELEKLLPKADDGYSYYKAFGEAVAKAQRDASDKEWIEWIEDHTQLDNINVGFYTNPKYGRNISHESWQEFLELKQQIKEDELS